MCSIWSTCAVCLAPTNRRRIDRGPAYSSSELRQKGLVRNIGLSNVRPRRSRKPDRSFRIVCVQNHYNLAHRTDECTHSRLLFVTASPTCHSFHSDGFHSTPIATLSPSPRASVPRHAGLRCVASPALAQYLGDPGTSSIEPSSRESSVFDASNSLK